MMQEKECDNYVIATGKQYTVKDFCILAFKKVGIELEWIGNGIEEKAINKKTKEVVIEIDSKYYRPIDVTNLKGNPSKAIKKLGFDPNKTSLEELVEIMIDYELRKEGNKIGEK